MPKADKWKKWASIGAIVGVCLTILSAVLGAVRTAANDRQTIVDRVARTEQAVAQQQKDTADRLSSTDNRLNTNDQRWTQLEPRLDTLAQDVAVMKAILERVERRVMESPGVHPLDRGPQKNQ